VRARLFTVLALGSALGCDPGPRPPARVDLSPRRGVVVARVGDLALTDLDVAAVAAERSIAPRAALDLLVREALLAVEARRSGLAGPVEVADDAWRARIQQLLARDVEARFSEATVPAGMVEASLDARHAELAHRGLRRVVHAVWMVAADAGAPQNEAALARMLVFREELRAATHGHPTDAQFRAAAQRLNGGASVRVEDLEPFDREGRTPSASRYVPAFAEAVWALSAAEPLSEPFVTSFGVHVALLLEEVPPMTRTDDEARAIVRADLIQRARADAARSLVLGLRQRERVQIREAALQQVERLARRVP
jgi:hypothetical protein